MGVSVSITIDCEDCGYDYFDDAEFGEYLKESYEYAEKNGFYCISDGYDFRIVCDDCYETEYHTCIDCGDTYSIDNGGMCDDEQFRCDDCIELHHEEIYEDNPYVNVLCHECAEINDQIPEPKWVLA